jgi:ubiquinone/menaquinone biosynthesis C-methylase UbiE
MDPKEIIEAGYDQLAPRYDDWSSGADPVLEWFVDELFQRLPRGSDVLELGCGSGSAAATLAAGRSYKGVDLSAGQLAIARTRLPKETFRAADSRGSGRGSAP